MRNRIAVAAAFAAVCSLLATTGCDMEGRRGERGPTITWWAVRQHRDRGPCTDCHLKVDGAGNPVPTITSASRMPHMDRGVCSNCHPIARGGGDALPPVVAGGGPGGQQVGMTQPLLPRGQTAF